MESEIEYSTEQLVEKIGPKGSRTIQLLDELGNKESYWLVSEQQKNYYR